MRWHIAAAVECNGGSMRWRLTRWRIVEVFGGNLGTRAVKESEGREWQESSRKKERREQGEILRAENRESPTNESGRELYFKSKNIL